MEEEKVLKKEVPQQEGIREQNLGQDILKKVVLKVASNLFKEEFQNLGSTILIEKNLSL